MDKRLSPTCFAQRVCGLWGKAQLGSYRDVCTPGFLMHGFWPAGKRRSLEFGCPGGPKNHSRRWGASPPTFWNGVWAFGAAHTTTIDDFRPAQKQCIKNPSVDCVSFLESAKSKQDPEVFRTRSTLGCLLGFWNAGPFNFWFGVDFEIGFSFADFGGPGGPGGPHLPSKLWGASRPTGWKANSACRGRRDHQNRRNKGRV
jgi:hypothetical protein